MKTVPAHRDQDSALRSVLHVGEAAAVASVLVKFQRKLGMRADVISLQEEDPYGYVRFYGGGIEVSQPKLHRIVSAVIHKWRYGSERKKIMKANVEPWKDLVPYEATQNKLLFRIGLQRRWYLRQIIDSAASYDVIHLHFYPQFAPHIRSKFPDKKIVIHHHGSALRNATPTYRRIQKEYEKSADLVLVSTEDLLHCLDGVDGTHLPIPCDTDVFYPSETPPKHEKILRIRNSLVSDTWADSTYKKLDLGLPYTVLERNIQYGDMRNVLCNYTHYIDWTPAAQVGRHVYTTLGLQALACGLTVLGCDFKMHSGGLPPEHQPHNVVRQLNKLYELPN